MNNSSPTASQKPVSIGTATARLAAAFGPLQWVDPDPARADGPTLVGVDGQGVQKVAPQRTPGPQYKGRRAA